jgi:hypothetical protein
MTPPATLLAMGPIVAGAVGGGNGTSVQVPDLFLCLSLSLAQFSGQVASHLYLWTYTDTRQGAKSSM